MKERKQMIISNTNYVQKAINISIMYVTNKMKKKLVIL